MLTMMYVRSVRRRRWYWCWCLCAIAFIHSCIQLCAITWLLIGYLNGTRIVDYVPVAVVAGFLGCLAYKVLYYCIKVSVGHAWYVPVASSQPASMVWLVGCLLACLLAC